MAIALSAASGGANNNNNPDGSSLTSSNSNNNNLPIGAPETSRSSSVAAAAASVLATTAATAVATNNNNNNNDTTGGESSTSVPINATTAKSGQTQPPVLEGAENNKKGAISKEMVDGCAVCKDEDGFDSNRLVYCDGCNLAVHQACYGIQVIPKDSWYCDPCSLPGETKTLSIKCELCPIRGGALKRTETGAWAHVLCALYIPEAVFVDTNAMDTISLSKIPSERYKRVCYICQDANKLDVATNGAKMNCALVPKGACQNYMHVTCAFAKGLLDEKLKKSSDTVEYHGYCKDHFRKKASSNNNKKREGSSNSSNPTNPSSTLNSASDSSQDNDSRRNNAIDQDKSNSDRTTVLPPTSLPSHLDLPTPTNSSQSLSSPTLTTSKSSPLANLTVPINPTISGNGGKSSASPTTSTPQKKKRATKSNQGQNNTIEQSSSTAGAPSRIDSNNPGAKPGDITPGVSTKSQDVYDWPSGFRDSEKNSSASSKSGRKKTASSAQSINPKTGPLNNQQLAGTSYDPSKLGCPNLSITTSPSQSSSSTKTATSSSASSSSSTKSCSTSPALTSPGMTNRGPTTRLESPLAHNSKTSLNIGNQSAVDSILHTNNVSPALNPLSTRINLDNPRPDLKKSLAVSSSLLSTTAPMQLTLGSAGDALTPPRFGLTGSFDQAKETSTTSSTSIPETAQPTIPPLIIPVPQGSATTSPVKSAAKTRAPTRNVKKKAIEANAAAPKPEPKPKTSRSKKGTSAENGEPTPPKVEPKSRGKGRANAKANTEANASSSVPSNNDDAIPKTPATSAPTKRKSRAASAESNSGTLPAPAKRIRKKKTDNTTAHPMEPKSNTQTALSLPANPQLSMNQPTGPGPLMISTPAQNNPLVHGFNAVDGQNVGNKYFSPMASPYTSYDGQVAASSLSRSSLSRLFTSSSSGANSNPTNQSLDDPTKALSDLRDYSWSQLSKYVLDQAEQFDIPMLIGTLHALRTENEKLQRRVEQLTLKRENLTASNARLDLPPQLLTQNLANSNPNFSNIVSGLTNSSKGMPIPSPGSTLSKQPLVITSSYNHMGTPGHLGPPNYMDRSSPLVAQTHSTINNIKSSSISTPSPPINALLALNNSNRAGLTVNQPYMPNSYPQLNATSQINSTPQGSSFYARQ